MLSAAPDGSLISERIRQSFNDAGYDVIGDFHQAVFSMPEYGIPQNRKRIVILGVRRGTFKNAGPRIIDDFYSNIMPSLKQPKRTVAEAIGDLPKFFPSVEHGKVVYTLQGSKEVPNHTPRHHSARDIKVFKLLTTDIETGKMRYVSIPKLKELYTQVTGKVSNIHKYYVLRRDEQSNTIPAHLFKDGFRHIHPDSQQCRTLTVREAARLQTFDDDYVFSGSMSDQYKMIGNAVPPAFAKILAEAMARVYRSYCPDKLPVGFPAKMMRSRSSHSYEQLLLAVERKKSALSARQSTQGLKGTRLVQRKNKPKNATAAKNRHG